MNILISACLFGIACRYDGKNKNALDLEKLKQKHTLIPVCPEVDGGLPTPRPPAQIQGGKVINACGEDVSTQFRRGAEAALKTALENNCRVAILKAKSPSCGKGLIYDGSFTGSLTKGNGITAQLLIENGIKVYTEDEISQIEPDESEL